MCIPVLPLCAVWPYLGLLPAALGIRSEGFFSAFYPVYAALTLPLHLAVVLWALRSRGDVRRLSFWCMALKLCHIPFYLGVFAVGVLLLLSAVVPALTLLAPAAVTLLFLADLLLLLTTSSCGLCALTQAARKGLVPARYAFKHGLLHLFFVTDVVSAVLVYRRLRHSPPRPH